MTSVEQSRKDGIRVTTYAGPGAEPEMHTVPWPKVRPKGALIRIGACGVCGTDQHILKDITLLGSWAFTANDLALGVQMLDVTRNKYPWRKMQTVYPFSVDGVKDAVADAMAMKTVKSTILPHDDMIDNLADAWLGACLNRFCAHG